MLRSRKISVPRNLEPLTGRAPENRAASDVGVDGVERVWRQAERMFQTGVHPALTLCIRHRGEVILDRSLGWAKGGGPGDTDTPVLATPETPFCIFSASKAITAMVIHLLDDQGVLHVDDRVCEYLPEFGVHGKEWATIRHVLTHRAGIPTVAVNNASELLLDWDGIVQLLCEQKPVNVPGRRLSYHAVTGGFILGEVVKRVTGKDIRQVLAEEILDPLGFEYMNYGVKPEQIEGVARNYFTGRPVRFPISTIARRTLGVSFEEVADISNTEAWMNACVPSGNVIATANELSRFFELLRQGGELDGVRVFDARTIRRATTETAFLELDLSVMLPVRYGVGLMLGARNMSPFGPRTEQAYGHLGFINCFGWADPSRELSVGLLTSGKPMISRHLVPLIQLMRTISATFPKQRYRAG